MKRVSLLMILLLGLSVNGFAQQDPHDPGIQDSIIVDDVYVDTTAAFAIVPVYGVIDDSIGFYNVPLRWHAPLGGVIPGATIYYSPISNWDMHYDSSLTSGSYLRQLGIYDLGGQNNTPLITSGQRVMLWRLRFIISPNAQPQEIVIDTTWDPRNLSLSLGLIDGNTAITPAFKRGGLHIQSNAAGGSDIKPIEFSLRPNYPNPFNPSTVIDFSIPQGSDVRLIVYNVLGQAVKTLFDGYKEPGNYSVIWDGTNDLNAPQTSGTYFYRLLTDNHDESRRMTLLR